MILYVNIDEQQRIISIADKGFHLGSDELEAEFADELIFNGHVEIYDYRKIPLYTFANGIAIARSEEEINADYIEPTIVLSQEERITTLERQNAELIAQLEAYEVSYTKGVQEA